MRKSFFSMITIGMLMAGHVYAQSEPERPGDTKPSANPRGQNDEAPATRPGAGRANPAPAGQAGQGQAGQGQAGQQNQSQQLEQHAAACLLIGNQEEVAFSQWGAEKAQNKSVQEFGRMMVTDHNKMITKLRKFTPQNMTAFELKGTAEQPTSVRGEERPATNRDERPVRAGEATVGKVNASNSLGDQLLAIKREKAEHCLSLAKQDLGNRKGVEFDKAFMGMQCAAHSAMLAELKALEGKTTGEFNELVAEAQKTTEEHLAHAKEIMENIKDEEGPSAREARQPRDTGREPDRIEDRDVPRERPAPQPRDNPAPPRRPN